MTHATIATEQWICRRLRRDIFAGVTTPDERRERIRTEILTREMQLAIAGKVGKTPLTWAELFQRTYGMPLEAADSRAA